MDREQQIKRALDKCCELAIRSGMFLLTTLMRKRLRFIKTGKAKTDGQFIYINPDWFVTIKSMDQFYIIAHEFMHIVYGHCELGKEYKYPLLHNYATDCIINTYLDKKIGIPNLPGRITYASLALTFGCRENFLKCFKTSDQLYTYLEGQVKNPEKYEGEVDEFIISGDEISEEGETEAIEQLLSEGYDENSEYISSQIALARDTLANKELKDKCSALMEKLFNSIGRKVAQANAPTYSRYNRRNFNSQILKKGNGENQSFIKTMKIYVDESASMNEKTYIIVNTLKLLLPKFKNLGIEVFAFNHTLRKIDLDSFVAADGGTSFREIFANQDCDLKVVITDGQAGLSPIENYKGDFVFVTNDKSFARNHNFAVFCDF